MHSIGIRELRQNASRYLARVVAGEAIEITDRGRPVARLVPITNSGWTDLIQAGEVIPATSGNDIRDIQPLPSTSPTTPSETLDALRANER